MAWSLLPGQQFQISCHSAGDSTRCKTGCNSQIFSYRQADWYYTVSTWATDTAACIVLSLCHSWATCKVNDAIHKASLEYRPSWKWTRSGHRMGASAVLSLQPFELIFPTVVEPPITESFRHTLCWKCLLWPLNPWPSKRLISSWPKYRNYLWN